MSTGIGVGLGINLGHEEVVVLAGPPGDAEFIDDNWLDYEMVDNNLTDYMLIADL